MTAKPAIDDAGDAGLLNHSEKTRITSSTHGVAESTFIIRALRRSD